MVCGSAAASDDIAAGNIIPNGDFSQGNTGFKSDLPYIKPAYNCLWGGYYTIAPTFHAPLLHTLIAPDHFSSPTKVSGKEQVFFANAGGTDPMTIWATKVKCAPNTRYRMSFLVCSLSGHILDGNPPHQVATSEWAADFEMSVNGRPGAPVTAGLGEYAKRSFIWNSQNSTSAIVKIVRLKMLSHGGGLIGLTDIRMVPIK